MDRYAIKHIPTNKFLHGDEGGVYLVPEEEAFMTFGRKKDADEILESYDEDTIFTEDGEFDISEFEVVKV